MTGHKTAKNVKLLSFLQDTTMLVIDDCDEGLYITE